MPTEMDIVAATEHGRVLMDIYARLRCSGDGAERVKLLRRAAESADALAVRLQGLQADGNAVASSDAVRSGLGGLGEVIERVMVLEREYRQGNGAVDDPMTNG